MDECAGNDSEVTSVPLVPATVVTCEQVFISKRMRRERNCERVRKNIKEDGEGLGAKNE